MLLFLNKVDRFREKIARFKLKKHGFPEFKGGHDVDAALAAVRSRFMKHSNAEGRSVFVHVVCALDTEMIKVVYNATRHSVIRTALASI